MAFIIATGRARFAPCKYNKVPVARESAQRMISYVRSMDGMTICYLTTEERDVVQGDLGHGAFPPGHDFDDSGQDRIDLQPGDELLLCCISSPIAIQYWLISLE